MVGMDEKAIAILLGVNREEVLYRFLSSTFIPLLAERGYGFPCLLQAITSWLYREGSNEKAANYLLDARSELD
jgi:hypothetical protein